MLSSRQVNITCWLQLSNMIYYIYVCILDRLTISPKSSVLTFAYTYPIPNRNFTFPSYRTSYTLTIAQRSITTYIYIYTYSTLTRLTIPRTLSYSYISLRVKQKLHIKCYFYIYLKVYNITFIYYLLLLLTLNYNIFLSLSINMFFVQNNIENNDTTGNSTDKNYKIYLSNTWWESYISTSIKTWPTYNIYLFYSRSTYINLYISNSNKDNFITTVRI